MGLRVMQDTQRYCQVCDEASAISMSFTHEKPGFEHISGAVAFCHTHAGILRAMIQAVLPDESLEHAA